MGSLRILVTSAAIEHGRCGSFQVIFSYLCELNSPLRLERSNSSNIVRIETVGAEISD
jgi:hypothetical protein